MTQAFGFDVSKSAFVSTAGVPLDDRGFRFGMHLFETIAVWRGRLLLDALHAHSLATVSERSGFPRPPDAWISAARQIVHELPDGVFRVFWTAGPGAPTDPVITPALYASFEEMVIPSSIIPGRADGEFVVLPEPHVPAVKSGNYWTHILAQQSVKKGSHGVMTTPDGWIRSAAMGNIFAVIDGQLVTPPTGPGTRAGVVREWILAKSAVESRRIHHDEITCASEVFITNSRLGICPLGRLGKATFSGPMVARALWKKYLLEVLQVNPADRG